LNFGCGNREKDHSRKGAKDAKPSEINRRFTQTDTDLFSVETAEKCPKDIKNYICVNLRGSAVKFLKKLFCLHSSVVNKPLGAWRAGTKEFVEIILLKILWVRA